MNLLRRLSKKPQQPVPVKAIIFLGIIALLGFADATFLTFEHYSNVIPPCTTTGCETVLTSSYAEIFGIPVAVLGALYYLVLLVCFVAHLESKKPDLLAWALRGTVVGFIMSMWFLFAQAFILHAFCQYCLGSVTTSTILFVTAIVLILKYDGDSPIVEIHDKQTI